MVNEGSRAIYVGPPSPDGLSTGDAGVVLALASHTAAHLQVGSRIFLVETEDLTPQSHMASRDPLDDSLEVGLSTFAVRQVYDAEGSTGVINAMAQLGHLTDFGEIAEEALAMVAARIRQDPSFRAVLASLDEDEGEGVLRLAAACLVRDAFQVDAGE